VGLNNTSPNATNALGFITTQAPRLSLTSSLGTPKVTWTSESSRLVLEQTRSLQGTPNWSTVTNGIEGESSLKTLALTNGTPTSFYRLQMK
jgi:hypothetical protein